MSKPTGVQLIGSIPCDSEEEVFRKMLERLPGRLSMIPDGETGNRGNFTAWQSAAFPEEVLSKFFRKAPAAPGFQLEPSHIKPTKYDTMAIKSYETFKKLVEEGVIPKDVRFQVCIPGIMSVMCVTVDPQYQVQAAPLYLKQLLDDIANLQATVPPENLAIQIDLAVEFALIEHVRGRLPNLIFGSGFKGDPFQLLLDWTLPLIRAIKSDVPLGFHLCYGDAGHKHFVEPEDASLLVQTANALVQISPRPVNWIHLPCPRDRVDEAYYAPLRDLHIGDAKLFLGVARENDLEGTKKRIEKAQSVRPSFGVATECGMGRTQRQDLDSILDILAEVSDTMSKLDQNGS